MVTLDWHLALYNKSAGLQLQEEVARLAGLAGFAGFARLAGLAGFGPRLS
jgi:hypothetical protein